MTPDLLADQLCGGLDGLLGGPQAVQLGLAEGLRLCSALSHLPPLLLQTTQFLSHWPTTVTQHLQTNTHTNPCIPNSIPTHTLVTHLYLSLIGVYVCRQLFFLRHQTLPLLQPLLQFQLQWRKASSMHCLKWHTTPYYLPTFSFLSWCTFCSSCLISCTLVEICCRLWSILRSSSSLQNKDYLSLTSLLFLYSYVTA